MDFCKLGSFPQSTLEYLTSLACMSSANLIKVTAVSSGEGQHINSPHLREILQNIISGGEKVIYMKGFTENQALEYLRQKNKGKVKYDA